MPPELELLERTETPTRPVPRPLLTIAIPTFNRADQLEGLLEVLEPQVASHPEVEVFVSDNASEDNTPDVIAASARRFALAGARLRTHRHATNIGSDANFAFCFAQAEGHFFWMCGDDDLIVPNAVAEILALLRTPSGQPAELDLVYATSYGYREDYRAERSEDPLGRRVHSIRDPHTFALVVNIMFTFISGIVVNRDRLKQLAREMPESFVGTNLVQLSWSLPLLLEHRRSAVLWTRPVAARIGNAHGYSLGHVFGRQLAAVVERLLPNRPDLSAPILNVALRRWLPSVAIEFRSKEADRLGLEKAHEELRAAYGKNPRYWLFTYPALKLPLPAARVYTKATAAASKLLYMAQVPGFWRKDS
ncbi:MAG TPA: glycosyltransferase family A protein [Acidobacteriaceae bacterium]|nr:glycosyltransferase family A protein [Acidobacteriaceae bacterium]